MPDDIPSAMRSAQLEEVAKIVYKKLVQDVTDALQMASKMVDPSEREKPPSYTLTTLLLSLAIADAYKRAGEDMQRFGLGK
jgi:hypothetical protein